MIDYNNFPSNCAEESVHIQVHTYMLNRNTIVVNTLTTATRAHAVNATETFKTRPLHNQNVATRNSWLSPNRCPF